MSTPLGLTLKIQLAMGIMLVVFGTMFGKVAVYSLLLGALIFVLPNVYFTYYAFRYCDPAWAPWIKLSFLKGEMGKLTLVSVGFALVFRFVSPLQEAFLFSGFIVMIALQWFIASYVVNTARSQTSSEKGSSSK